MNHPENDKRNSTNCGENQTERKGESAEPEKDLDELILGELILDRLVDNDLNPEEYKAVLKLVEEKPDGWRRLALAFLESQALENELSELRLDDSYLSGGFSEATEVSDAMEISEAMEISGAIEVSGAIAFPIHDAAAVSDREVADLGAEDGQYHKLKQTSLVDALSVEGPAVQDQHGQVVANHRAKNELESNRRGSTFLRMTKQAIPAIAACLVIVVIATIYVREMRNQRDRMENVVTLPSTVNSKQDPSDGRNQNYIQLVGNNDGESMRAPVYDHDTFDQKEAAAGFAKFTPRLREVLTSSGLNANERTHVMPIKDSEGNKIILPIKEFKLTPSKWEGYQ